MSEEQKYDFRVRKIVIAVVNALNYMRLNKFTKGSTNEPANN